jgi:hypothetical protein
MTLLNFKFSARQFASLSEAERLFFVRLANVANDLRYVRLLTVTAAAATKRYAGAEQEVVLHQMIFGLRQWYAILDAGWEVVRSDWNGAQLGKKFYPLLSKGRTAYDELKKYFSGSNLVANVRDHFASHYEVGFLPRILRELPDADVFHFVSSTSPVNTFYSFAENVRNVALIATSDDGAKNETLSWEEARVRRAVQTLYGEAGKVSEKFEAFLDDLLPIVLRPCSLERCAFISTAVADPAKWQPLIFVDEEAIVRRAEAKAEK